MSFRERFTRARTPSTKHARGVGRSALLGEGSVQKYTPNQEELLKSSQFVPSEGTMIGTTFNRQPPIASTADRSLRDVVVIGNTYVGVVDKIEAGSFRGTEFLVLPYGSAIDMKSSVFLQQTITPGANDSLSISRESLALKGIQDPQVSRGKGDGGHLDIVIRGDRIHYGDNDSSNGTRLISGSAMETSENPELVRFVDDLRANPQYLYGATDGRQATILPYAQ